MSEFTFYFSGLETGIETTEEFLKAGMGIKGGMMSFLTFRGSDKNTQWLKRFRAEYKGKVMIDSGAHAFIYAENIEAGTVKGGWHPVNKDIDSVLQNIEEYMNSYFDWLENNRDAYDYAVEMDIQKIVGQEKVDAWREEFIKRKIPVVIVLHPRAGDTIDVVKKWKEKGVTYFGRGEFDKENIQDVKMLRDMKDEGVDIHIFAFSPTDLGKFTSLITSSDSSSWLSAGKLGTLIVAKGRQYENIDLKQNPIMVKKAINSEITKVIPKEEIEKQVKKHKYLYLNWYNMLQLQKWVDTISKQPQYMKQIESAENGETVLPAWVNEFDKFGRPKSIYLKSRFNNYKCYSDDTEILTENGWKLFKDLNGEEKVATLENGELKYVKPIDSFEYVYEDEYLYGLKGTQFDLLVTPNHNVYVRRRNKEFELMSIENIIKDGKAFKSYQFKKDAIWVGEKKEGFVLPFQKTEFEIPAHYNGVGIIPTIKYKVESPSVEINMNDWLEFLGYFISEGHTVSKPRNGNYDVGVSQYKKESKKKIGECLSKLPLHFNITKQGFVFHNKQLWLYLKQFGKSKDKFIPREVLSLPSEQLRIIFDALILGDGHIYESGQIVYYTISKRLADDVQEIALKIGYAANISYLEKRRGYLVYIIRKRLTPRIATHNTAEKVFYKGRKVYSVQVPSGVIYVRRNGKAIWSGNSGVYAKIIQKNALECNNCVVKDVCPVYKENSLCYFTPHWKKLGEKTRNKEAIVSTLQNILADKIARLERGKYFEDKSGGMLDKQVSALEMDIVKTLEILHRIMYGVAPTTNVNVLTKGDSKINIGGDKDSILEELRKEYGDEMAGKIEKKIEKKEVEIAEVKNEKDSGR